MSNSWPFQVQNSTGSDPILPTSATVSESTMTPLNMALGVLIVCACRSHTKPLFIRNTELCWIASLLLYFQGARFLLKMTQTSLLIKNLTILKEYLTPTSISANEHFFTPAKNPFDDNFNQIYVKKLPEGRIKNYILIFCFVSVRMKTQNFYEK